MFIKLYAITLPVFFAIDMVWLGLVAKNFYAKHIGFLMKTNVDWVAALLFYLLFIVGLIVFIIMPAIENNSWVHAVLYGMLFGLITYATYDLTNLATLKDWPLIITIIDLVWGMTLSGLVSLVSFLIANKIGV